MCRLKWKAGLALLALTERQGAGTFTSFSRVKDPKAQGMHQQQEEFAVSNGRWCWSMSMSMYVFPEKELFSRPQSQFSQSCVCERSIYSHDKNLTKSIANREPMSTKEQFSVGAEIRHWCTYSIRTTKDGQEPFHCAFFVNILAWLCNWNENLCFILWTSGYAHKFPLNWYPRYAAQLLFWPDIASQRKHIAPPRDWIRRKFVLICTRYQLRKKCDGAQKNGLISAPGSVYIFIFLACRHLYKIGLYTVSRASCIWHDG